MRYTFIVLSVYFGLLSCKNRSTESVALASSRSQIQTFDGSEYQIISLNRDPSTTTHETGRGVAFRFASKTGAKMTPSVSNEVV